MSRHIQATRLLMGGFPTTEPVLLHVEDGRLTLAFDDGDRIQFDAHELVAAASKQLFNDDSRGTA